MTTFLKFVGYILLKWICFFIYQFIESGNELNWGQPTNYEGRLLAAFMLLTLPILEIIVLIFPFQFALKQRGWKTILILVFAFMLEFLIGWYATNQKLATWMIVKLIFSIIIFYSMYKKQLN